MSTDMCGQLLHNPKDGIKDTSTNAWGQATPNTDLGDWARLGVREFKTGATRSPLQDKLQYEGFFSPLVLRRRAQYMHKHRHQSDGNTRAADNWQKGMPLETYIDSGMRHFIDWWLHHRQYGAVAEEALEEALCALMFNAEGYLYELLKWKNALKKESTAPSTDGPTSVRQGSGVGYQPSSKY